MNKTQNDEIVIIKKYANRRLYNTQTSCYITLEDLFDMTKRGEVFEVKDAKSDEDLTRSVLTQIIFEQEGKGYNLLPVGFLRQLISLYGNSVSGLLPNYLEMSMEKFLNHQEQFKSLTQDWKEYTPIGIFEKLTKKNMEIFNNTLNMFSTSTDEDKQ